MKVEERVGMKFGRLTVIAVSARRDTDPKWTKFLDCVCECDGNVGRYMATNVVSGHTTSCGCYMREVTSKIGTANIKHGYRPANGTAKYASEYQVWANMKDRCYNPNNSKFPSYGGRGITVCEQWLNSFPQFLADIGPRPSRKHSIDRIDNNGHYNPGNCRWATNTEQSRNRRGAVLLEFQGKTKPVEEWCEMLGLSRPTVMARIKSGYTVQDALTLPVRPYTKHQSR